MLESRCSWAVALALFACSGNDVGGTSSAANREGGLDAGGSTGNPSNRGGAGGAATASGGAATASGGAATASGGAATASGGAATASGGAATASGGVATASGGAATASGGAATASGGAATASGGAGGSAAATGGGGTGNGGSAGATADAGVDASSRVDGGASRDASLDSRTGFDAAVEAGACRFPVLGIQRFDTDTWPYAGLRLWYVQLEIERVMEDVARLTIDAVEGRSTGNCANATYDGAPPAYKDRANVHITDTGNCPAAEGWNGETLVTFVGDGSYVWLGYGDFTRTFTADVTTTARRFLATGEPVVIEGHARLAYSASVTGAINPSTRSDRYVHTLSPNAQSTGFTVSDSGGARLRVVVTAMEDTHSARAIAPVSETISFDESFTDLYSHLAIELRTTSSFVAPYGPVDQQKVQYGSLEATYTGGPTGIWSNDPTTGATYSIRDTPGGGDAGSVNISFATSEPWPQGKPGACAAPPKWFAAPRSDAGP